MVSQNGCTFVAKARIGIAEGRGQGGSTPYLSFQPPYSLLFFNYHDFSRALLTLPVIVLGIPTLAKALDDMTDKRSYTAVQNPKISISKYT